MTRALTFKMSVRKAVERIEGSYALGILCRDYPGTIIAVKKDSPLIFGFWRTAATTLLPTCPPFSNLPAM